jgi:hypothetical protein
MNPNPDTTESNYYNYALLDRTNRKLSDWLITRDAFSLIAGDRSSFSPFNLLHTLTHSEESDNSAKVRNKTYKNGLTNKTFA